MFLQLVLTILLLTGSAAGDLPITVDTFAPGHPLYFLDRLIENRLLEQATTPDQAVQMQLRFAEERLLEIQALAQNHNPNDLSETITAFDQAISTAANMASFASSEASVGVSDAFDASFTQGGNNLQDGNYCTEPVEKMHPVGQALAEEYQVTYAEIMGWFCQGYGFGEITLAYSASQETGVAVAELFGLRASGLGWGEIMQMLGLIGHGDEADVPEIEPPAEAPEGRAAHCDGAQRHPKGEALADQFGVPYEEIMAWFCQGYGFGEITLAYEASLASGKPVADIFALRASGLGWGQIMQELGLKGKPEGSADPDGNSEKDNKPDKEPKTEKNKEPKDKSNK
jgi:hypothetical protein